MKRIIWICLGQAEVNWVCLEVSLIFLDILERKTVLESSQRALFAQTTYLLKNRVWKIGLGLLVSGVIKLKLKCGLNHLFLTFDLIISSNKLSEQPLEKPSHKTWSCVLPSRSFGRTVSKCASRSQRDLRWCRRLVKD